MEGAVVLKIIHKSDWCDSNTGTKRLGMRDPKPFCYGVDQINQNAPVPADYANT